MVKQLLFRLAKSKWMGKAVGSAFRFCPWAIPGKKLYCSERVLVMEHPCPAYPNHVILSPRKPIADLTELAQEKHAVYGAELWKAVAYLATHHEAYRNGFTLVANGGRRQEVGQVHFHLFTGQELVSETVQELQESEEYSNRFIHVYRPSSPAYDLHLILQPNIQSLGSEQTTPSLDLLAAALQLLPKLAGAYPLEENGYSLICQHRPGDDLQHPTFHLIFGTRKSTAEPILCYS
ncbi:MAG: HIT domain-containing protein [Clostridia bacterium]|nr:HIT domain-containing protein [Clostridia bacterium]